MPLTPPTPIGHPLGVWLLCLLGIGVIGAIDAATGFELSMSIFYLVPVAAAAWRLGRGGGVAMAVVAACTWLLSDILSGHAYSHAWIGLWNAAVRLGFFWLVAELLCRLRGQLIRERARADRDGLTDLLNAAAFCRVAQGQIDLLHRLGKTGALAFIDLDNFKQINDGLGHAEGDRVLAAVADCIRDVMRRSDIAGRVGGDEFAVLLADTEEAGAATAFERLRSDLAGIGRTDGIPVRFSGGLLVFDGPVQIDALLKGADDLMYGAKREGKGLIFSQRWGEAVG